MGGSSQSTSENINNAQNNLNFYNTGSIEVTGNIGNGNTTQGGTTSSTGGSVGLSATVALGPSMPGLL